MEQCSRTDLWIDNVNRATIRNVDPKRDSPLIGNKTIVSGKMFIARWQSIDYRNSVAVHLFGSHQRPVAHTKVVSSCAMSTFKPSQCFLFIVGDVVSRDSRDEGGDANPQLIKRHEPLDRLRFSHLKGFTASLTNRAVIGSLAASGRRGARRCGSDRSRTQNVRLGVARRVYIAARVVGAGAGGARGNSYELFRVSTLSAGDPIKLSQGRIVTEQRL